MEMLATFHFHEILPQEDRGTDLLGLGNPWSFTHLWGAYSKWNIEFKIFFNYFFLGGGGGGTKDKVCWSLLAYSKLNSTFLLKNIFSEWYPYFKNILIYEANCNQKLH